MKYPTIECSECGKDFARMNSRILTCSERCSHVRHQRLKRVRMRQTRTSTSYDYAKAGDLRREIAPLNALVRKQERPARVAGWWR